MLLNLTMIKSNYRVKSSTSTGTTLDVRVQGRCVYYACLVLKLTSLVKKNLTQTNRCFYP